MASTDFSRPMVADGGAPRIQVLTPGVIALLAGLAAVGLLSTNIMLPAFPAIAASLHVSPRDLGITLSSFFFVFAFGQIFVGPISDRFGRKKLVVGGLTLFVIGSAICAFAPTLEVMVAGRVVQGLGVCAASVLSRAIARDLFDGEMLSKALAMTMIAMAAAPGFSPLVGGLIATYLDWRAIFVFVGMFAAILGFFYLSRMGETHPPDRRAPLSLSHVLKSYGQLCLDVRFICPAIAISLIIGSLYASFAAAPVILMSEIGMSPIQYGLFNAATVFVVFGSGMAAPRLAHRFGDLLMTRIGAGLASLGGVALLVLYRQPDLVSYTIAMVIFLVGMGISNPLGMAIALRPFGERAGLASALVGFLQMSTAAATTAISTMVSAPPATMLGWMQVSGGLIALLLLGYLTRANRRASSAPANA